MKPHTPQHIATVAARAHQASPEHRRFAALLAKIEAAKQRLAAWHEQLPLFTSAYNAQIEPEIERLRAARREWAIELGEIASRPSRPWSKTELATLEEMVCDLCGELLGGDPDADPEIKALFNRFSKVDYDTIGRREMAEMKSAVERMTGVEFGDGDESMGDFIERAQAEMARRAGVGEPAEYGEQIAGHEAPQVGAQRRKRAAAKSAAQRRAEEDAKRISQSVREVYRKLAAALHPDRDSADASPEERARRLELMQRTNAAYEAGDLLALLSLQLQIEQIDVAHAAGVAAAQVKHFNKVLAEQLREVQAEIDGREVAFCESYGIEVMQRLDPGKLGSVLQEMKRDVAGARAELAHEQRALRGEPAAARRWLKQRRAEMRLHDELQDLMSGQFEQFLNMAEGLHERREKAPSSGGRRKRR